MKLYIFPGCLVFLTFVFSACDKGKDAEVEPKDRPYEVSIPEQFSRNFDITSANQLTVAGVELGRMLFYEKKLSGNNTMSCASCHKQERAFADGNAFSVGIDGKPGRKNSMSIANVLWENRFFWDGRAGSLESQAVIPIQDTLEMHENLGNAIAELQASPLYPPKFKLAFGSNIITADHVANALSQFQRTLISSNSKFDQYLKGVYTPTEQELRGIQLFRTHPDPLNKIRGGNCGDCHLGALLNGDQDGLFGFHNNGLDDDAHLSEGVMAVTGNLEDKGKFKVPTLRNIALTAPYMHDGRFNTLAEVLDHYNDHISQSKTLDPLITSASNEIQKPGDNSIKLYLTEQEKLDIIAFLNMLTDEEFTKDKRFANPFDE
jgi:cytochrome c peroxidase